MTSLATGARLAPLYRTAIATSLVALSFIGAVRFADNLESTAGNFGDFYGNIWWAGHRILDWKPAVPDGLTAWPPTATVFVAPFSLLPYWAGLAAWTAISVGAFVVGLRVAGCRDRRALVVAVLSPPALACLWLGNLSLVLAAGVAVVWAYRDRSYVSGLTAGVLVAAKIWLWPILIFFVITRRWVSLAAASAWCVAGASVWLVLSPATIRSFPAWSSQGVENYAHWGTGLSSALLNAGVSVTVTEALVLAAGVLILAAGIRAKDEVTILAICLAAALVASPLVWNHYYVVLFVPLAVKAPTLGPLWFAPYLAGSAFLLPATHNQAIVCGLAALAGTVLVTGGVATWTLNPRRVERSRLAGMGDGWRS